MSDYKTGNNANLYDPITGAMVGVVDMSGKEQLLPTYTLDAAGNVIGLASPALLLTWAYTQTFQLVSATRNADGAITTASITWPDGVSGVFTSDTLSTDFPGAIDAWHATYLGATTKTVTQPLVTRDANGAVTVQPAITIA